MKLTSASNYALRTLVYLVAKKKEKVNIISSEVIAKDCGVKSFRFLLKVLKPLVGIRILHSVKGPSGGYSLARPANEISLLEVIEAVDNEPISGKVPPVEKETNPNLTNRLETITQQTAELVRKHLGKIKLSDLCTKD